MSKETICTSCNLPLWNGCEWQEYVWRCLGCGSILWSTPRNQEPHCDWCEREDGEEDEDDA
jgi:RNase P subunit RPR2